MAVLTKITQRSLADNAVTSAHVQGDVIAAGDIADDAIGTAELANDISISTSGNIATTGSGTLAVAGTSALTGNVTAAGTLGVTGASTLTGATTVGGTLGVTGAATVTSIKQTDAQNLSGTYSAHELIVGKTFTLNGNLTVNDNLVLASMSGAGTDVTIQPDSTARTITSTGGTGILQGGELLAKNKNVLTGMTGILGNGVTGGSGLTDGSNLTTLGTIKSGILLGPNEGAGVQFPSGHVIHMKHLTKTTGGALSTSATPSATTMHTLTIRTTTLGSKLYVVMHMSPQLQADGSDGSFTMRSSVDNYVANLSWGRVFRKTYQNYVQWHSTITYLHDHGQPIGTEITYKSYLSATGGQIKLGDYWGTTGLEYAHQATVIMEIAP